MFSAKQIGLANIKSIDERISSREVLTDDVLRDVLKLGFRGRYDYFMKYSVTHHEVYALFEGNDLYVYRSGGWVCPLFPHASSAAFAVNQWKIDAEPVPIPLDEFIDEIGKMLSEKSICLEIFPNPIEEETIFVSLEEFIFDVVGAWEEYNEVELDIDASIRGLFVERQKKSLFRRIMRGRPNKKLP